MSDITATIKKAQPITANITKTGPKGEAGNDGADGASSYTYVAYASDDQGTGFSLTPAANLTFIAVLTTDTEIDTPEASDFSGLWQEYKSDIQSINDLTDVSADSPSNKQILEYDGTNYVNVLNPVFKDVKNNTASLIPAGTLVSVVDDAGANPLVETSDKGTNSDVAGILIADLEANGSGIIQLTGTIQESFIDTSGITAGATIYLGSNGAYTDAKPTTGHIIRIGKAGVSNPANGSLLLDLPSSSTAFADLNDTTITDGAENDLLTLESGVWVNKTRGEIGKGKEPYKYSPLVSLTRDFEVYDSFDRENSSSLGNADSGQAWQALGGSSDLKIVNGNAVTVNSGDINIISRSNIQGNGSVMVSVADSGQNNNSVDQSCIVIGKDSDNYYVTRFSGDKLQLFEVIGGSETVLGDISSVIYGGGIPAADRTDVGNGLINFRYSMAFYRGDNDAHYVRAFIPNTFEDFLIDVSDNSSVFASAEDIAFVGLGHGRGGFGVSEVSMKNFYAQTI